MYYGYLTIVKQSTNASMLMLKVYLELEKSIEIGLFYLVEVVCNGGLPVVPCLTYNYYINIDCHLFKDTKHLDSSLNIMWR